MPATNKLLLEAGYTPFRYNPIFGHPPPDGITDLIAGHRAVERDQPGHRPAATRRSRELPLSRGVELWGRAVARPTAWQATASYVTGAHSTKVGYQGNRLDLLDKDHANHTQLAYRFNQGVPNAVSYCLPDFGRRTITKTNGVFIQDSWTHDRLTLQGALRYDRASSYAPVELNGTTNTSFLNPTPITIQETPGVDAYNDITPRVGVAYDLFGNGKTALKFNWGKYLAYAANDSAVHRRPTLASTIVRSVTNRGWTRRRPTNYVVDCDLLNPALQDGPQVTSAPPRRRLPPTSASRAGRRSSIPAC